MSRSGYSEDCENDWGLICWRGAVASAIKGKRGQAFLKEMRDALDHMPVKRLITNDLENEGEVCAIGSVGVVRGVNMQELDPDFPEQIAEAFGVARALVCEIEYINDECWYGRETPEQRHARMLSWVNNNIVEEK